MIYENNSDLDGKGRPTKIENCNFTGFIYTENYCDCERAVFELLEGEIIDYRHVDSHPYECNNSQDESSLFRNSDEGCEYNTSEENKRGIFKIIADFLSLVFNTNGTSIDPPIFIWGGLGDLDFPDPSGGGGGGNSNPTIDDYFNDPLFNGEGETVNEILKDLIEENNFSICPSDLHEDLYECLKQLYLNQGTSNGANLCSAHGDGFSIDNYIRLLSDPTTLNSCLQTYPSTNVNLNEDDAELFCAIKQRFPRQAEDVLNFINDECNNSGNINCKFNLFHCLSDLQDISDFNDLDYDWDYMFYISGENCGLPQDEFRNNVIDDIVVFTLRERPSPSLNDPSKIYYNWYGYNGLLQFIDGYWIYERSESWFEVTQNVHYIFDNGWRKFDLDELPPDIHFVFMLANDLIDNGHNILDLFGLVPGGGEIFDGINAAWYYSDGDIVNGSISSASMLPIIGYGANATKAARNTVKLSDGAFHSKEGLEYARRYYGSLGLTENAISHVFRHKVDDLSKPIHGIFNDPEDIIGTIDIAFNKLNNNFDVVADVVSRGNRTVIIDMKRFIGKQGGFAGDQSDLQNIKIVFDGISNKILTAYPI